MKKIIYLFLISLIIVNPGYSGFSKVGTAAAQFLKIGIGARAVGMGESFVAVANDASTLFWNPAGMMNVDKISLSVSHSEWFADIYHDYAGFVYPISNSGRLGISAIALNTSEQEVTTVEQPDGNGLFYDVSDIAVGISYARALTDRFSTGLTVKYIRQNAYNESAHSFAVDIGTYLRTGFHGLTIAMCLSNFGGRMQLQGRDLISLTDIDPTIEGNYRTDARLKTESWPLPLNFRIGIAMDIIGGIDPFFSNPNNRFTIAIDGNHPNDNVERVNIGGEYSWHEMLFARMGYKINYDAEKWAYGAGLKFKIGNQIICVDYALVDFSDLGKVSRFSAELRF